ncbi:MAG TPA: PqqD family peptide modification chaperone [Candidatus Cybelea sp.]
MNEQSRPRFGKGVKLRHDGDGSVMLLVPEGALVLNPPAAVALTLVDGNRTLEEIVDTVVERFEVAPQRARDELNGLFERLAQRGFLRCLS